MDIICMCTEDGKKRKIKYGRGERTEGGAWTGAHLINRLTFHSSLPHTALVAFWVASPSNSKIPASISLISFRIYTFLSGTWYLISFCPYDYEHKYNPNNDLTLSKPSPGSPLLNFFFFALFCLSHSLGSWHAYISDGSYNMRITPLILQDGDMNIWVSHSFSDMRNSLILINHSPHNLAPDNNASSIIRF